MAARGQYCAQTPGARHQGVHHHPLLQPEPRQGDLSDAGGGRDYYDKVFVSVTALYRASRTNDQQEIVIARERERECGRK